MLFAGKTPGVYSTWDDARRQVDAFKGAMHKSFSTAAEAKDWVKQMGGSSEGAGGEAAEAAAGGAAAADDAFDLDFDDAFDFDEDDAAAAAAAAAATAATAEAEAEAAAATAAATADVVKKRKKVRGALQPQEQPQPQGKQQQQQQQQPAALSEGTYVMHFDGACRGNPGPSGAGAVIRREVSGDDDEGGEGEIVFELASYLGRGRRPTPPRVRRLALTRARERRLNRVFRYMHAVRVPVHRSRRRVAFGDESARNMETHSGS